MLHWPLQWWINDANFPWLPCVQVQYTDWYTAIQRDAVSFFWRSLMTPLDLPLELPLWQYIMPFYAYRHRANSQQIIRTHSCEVMRGERKNLTWDSKKLNLAKFICIFRKWMNGQSTFYYYGEICGFFQSLYLRWNQKERLYKATTQDDIFIFQIKRAEVFHTQ